MTTASPRLQCPKDGCRQRAEQVLDNRGSVDRDFVKCLFHGEVFVGVQPDLDQPGMTPRSGTPMYHGVRL